MNLVTLHHVGVAYDGYEALKNVDLTIAQDDFLGIIGPNGGGKTTLVKAILGTVPHTGEVVLAPELFRGKERLIGYMPQISNFDRTFPISVLEVVLSGLQGHRGFVSRYTKEDRAKALRLLETSGIGETARSPIGEVSGGQMQRALLCRAVISDPKLLILDEPVSGVDNEGLRRFYEMAARYDDESEAALRAVIGSETEEADAMSEGEKRAQAVTDFLTSLQAQREALGIPPAASPQEFSDEYWDNLFYEAKTERLAERGLW